MSTDTKPKTAAVPAKAPTPPKVDVEVKVTSPTVLADKTPGGQDAAHPTASDNPVTPTQITERIQNPNVPDEVRAGEPKVVRFDAPPGTKPGPFDRTTVVEEVRFLDPGKVADDLSDQINAMRVLARTQGINQAVKLKGSKKGKDGANVEEHLIVYMDGSHTIEEVPIATNPNP